MFSFLCCTKHQTWDVFLVKTCSSLGKKLAVQIWLSRCSTSRFSGPQRQTRGSRPLWRSLQQITERKKMVCRTQGCLRSKGTFHILFIFNNHCYIHNMCKMKFICLSSKPPFWFVKYPQLKVHHFFSFVDRRLWTPSSSEHTDIRWQCVCRSAPSRLMKV